MNRMKEVPHAIYTPKKEIEICLNCPLKECKKTVCRRFKAEKEKLKRR